MPTTVRNVLLEVLGKSDDAQRSLRSIGDTVRSLPDDKEIRVNAETAKAQAKIREMIASLKAVDRTTATPEVRIAITKALTKLEDYEARLDDVDGRRVTAHLEVEADRDRITQELAKVAKQVETFTSKHQTATIEFDAKTEAATSKAASLRKQLEALNRSGKLDLSSELATLEAKLAGANAELKRVGEGAGLKRLDAQIEKANRSLDKTLAKLASAENAKKPDASLIQQIELEAEAARQKIDDLTRRRAEATIVIQAKTEAAQAKIDAIKAAIAEIPKRATVGVDLARDRLTRQLAAAEAELEALTSKRRTATLDFDAKTEAAAAKVAALNVLVDALPDHKNIDFEVNRSITRDLEQVFDGVAKVGVSLGKAGGEAQRFGGEFSNATARISTGFISFGGVLGPIFAIVLALIGAIGVSLVAALAALAASLAAAAAAVGVLGVALVAALGPAVGLAVAVASRLGKVMEALKATDAAALATGVKSAEGSAAATAAAERQAAAVRGLQVAEESLTRATVAAAAARTEAYREWDDAIEAASDAIRGIDDAELSLEDSRLSIKEAEQALKEFKATLGDGGEISDAFQKFTDVDFQFDAGAIAGAVKSAGGDENSALRAERLILNIRKARQQEKNAIDGVSDAQTKQTRTQERANEFTTKGIAASAGYTAAVLAVRDAERQVADARRAANKAAADPAANAAVTKAALLVGDLTRREQQLLKAIQRVRKELRGAFQRATDAVFGGMIRALERLPRLINPLRGAFGRFGRDIAAALDIFSQELIRPEWIAAIRRFLAAGGRISRVFARGIFVPFLRIVRDLALSALPALEQMLRDAGRALTSLSNTGPGRLQAFVDAVVKQLRIWLSLTGQLARVFIAFVRGASGEGGELAQTLTDSARRLADFLNTARGQNKIRDFLRDMIPQAKEFLKNVGLLILAFLRFSSDVAPALTLVLRIMSKLASAVGLLKQATNPLGILIASFTRGETAADQMRSALDRVRDAEERLRDAQERGERAVRDLIRARRDARRELSDFASAAAGAKLDKRRATLDLTDARKELRALKARGASASDLERARLDVADAEQRVLDATREATRAQQDNTDAQNGGIKGTSVYKSALGELRTAADETGRAMVDLAKAQRTVADLPPPKLSAWDQIKAKAKSIVGSMPGIGRDIIRGLQTGLTSSPVGEFLVGLLRNAVNKLLSFLGIKSPSTLFAGIGRDMIAGLVNGIREKFQAVRDVIGNLMSAAIEKVKSWFGRAREVGVSLGAKIADGIGAGLGVLKSIGKSIINKVIDLFNDGIALINKATPGALKIKGKTIIPGIPDIQPIDKLGLGGIVSRGTIFQAGERTGQSEAVLPLTSAVLGKLARAIMGQLSGFAMTPAFAGGGRGRAPTPAPFGGTRVHIEKLENRMEVQGGGSMDPAEASVGFGQYLERRWGGDTR